MLYKLCQVFLNIILLISVFRLFLSRVLLSILSVMGMRTLRDMKEGSYSSLSDMGVVTFKGANNSTA